MPTHQQVEILPYSVEQLFALVGDVASYPRFLPWCVGARILSGNADPMGGGEMLAELMIRFKMFQESYVSRVKFVPPTPTERDALIEAMLERGPFSHLSNRWQFIEIGPNETEVRFEVDFSFKTAFLDKIVGPLFNKATQMMVDAFRKRAESMYPPKS